MSIEFHRDGPWELPDGWVWARLGDVCKHPARIDPAKELEGEFRYIDLSAVEDGKITHFQTLPVARAPSRARQAVRTGDTLLSCVRVYLRNNALVTDELDNAVASTAFCVLQPGEAVDQQYLFWFAHSQRFTHTLIPLQRGNSPPAVLDDEVRNQFIPIAPFPEQRRIVARIDELFTEIADGEAALARARDDLDAWHRALLKAAVTGELTREWRETHRPNGTGLDIVNRAAELKARFSVRFNRNRPVEGENGELPDLPEIPNGWAWAKLSDFTWASSYGTSMKCAYDASGVAVLRIPNIRSGRIDLADLKRATTELDLADDDLLDVGDLLIVRTNGSEDLIGRAAIVHEPLAEAFYFASYLIRFRIVANPLLRQWISLHFESPVARAWIRKNIASSAGQYNISQTSLMKMPIPVPPEPEMKTSLDTFHELESTRDDAAMDARDAYRAASRARQSILKVAFEGRLVAQDPRDEPAERLFGDLNEQAETNGHERHQRAKRRPPGGGSKGVIAGLDPAIHAATKLRQSKAAPAARRTSMDARVKPAHDE